jgi:hypothetical protein
MQTYAGFITGETEKKEPLKSLDYIKMYLHHSLYMCVCEFGHMLSSLSLMPGTCRPCNKPAISTKCNFTSGCVITSLLTRALFNGIIN